MRPDGLWHPRLLHLTAALGHGDLLVVADAGLPVPPGVESVDLVWRAGEPGFLPVLDAVLGALVTEHAVTAAEAADPDLLAGLDKVLTRHGVSSRQAVPHTEFRALTRTARAIVRTGEATAYANVLLRAGVPF
jgi:D-ribose pyranase